MIDNAGFFQMLIVLAVGALLFVFAFREAFFDLSYAKGDAIGSSETDFPQVDQKRTGSSQKIETEANLEQFPQESVLLFDWGSNPMLQTLTDANIVVSSAAEFVVKTETPNLKSSGRPKVSTAMTKQSRLAAKVTAAK